MPPDQSDWDDFWKCVGIQLHLDLEAVDIMWWEPLKSFYKWANAVTDPVMKGLVGWLAVKVGGTAAKYFFNTYLSDVLQNWLAALATDVAAAAKVALGKFCLMLVAILAGTTLLDFVKILADCGLDQMIEGDGTPQAG